MLLLLLLLLLFPLLLLAVRCKDRIRNHKTRHRGCTSACPGPSPQAPSSHAFPPTTTDCVVSVYGGKNKKYLTVTRRKRVLLAWLEAHEHRQDPGENGRRIEHFIGENEHLY